MMKEQEITLTELLESRDRRWNHEKFLMAHYPKLTLICLTVVMPGKVKRNARSLIVAKAATQALQGIFDEQTSLWEQKDLPTGFEAYCIFPHTPPPQKREKVRLARQVRHRTINALETCLFLHRKYNNQKSFLNI